MAIRAECWRTLRRPPLAGAFHWSVLLALALLAVGCAGPAARLDRIEPIEPRLHVIPGRTLVAPVRLTGQPSMLARLDDDREVSGSLWWLRVRPSPGPAPAWLPDPGAWSAAAMHDPEAGEGAGFWAVAFDLPPDAAGQGLWLNGRRLALNWLGGTGAGERALAEIEAAPPWPQLADRGRRRAQLVWFEPEAQSPLTRWRFTLISAGLGGDGPPALADVFADRVVEAFARQLEDRWAIALDRLARDDAELARRFSQRVAAAVDFGDAIAPAFEPDSADLATLLTDLLSDDLRAQDRMARADAWLRSLGSARAWVIDDVGAGDAPGAAALAVIGLANLGSQQRLGWAIDAAGGAAAEPIPVDPFAVEVVATLVPQRGVDGHPLRDLEVTIGEERMALRVQDEALLARPPGLRLNPMLRDWTLQAWRSGSAAAVAPGAPGATAAMLRQSRRSDGEAVWTIYIEARRPLRDGGVRERGRLWLGPRGDPLAVVELDPARSAAGEGGRGGGGVRISESEDRWVAEVEIDPAWIEPGESGGRRLRIGLERTDAAGERSAWPRPMLPWQDEPGRALVDLEAWGSLRSGGGG